MTQIAAIIPFHNAADTLPRLLDALRAQTLRDFSVIFIDDQSSDNGRDIVASAATNDARFILLDGVGEGPGSARNIGLDEADRLQSEFITFIDADDLIVPNAFETALSMLQSSNCDIVHYPWATHTAEANCCRPPSQPEIYVWNKTYRRASIEGIRFLKSNYAEDLAYYLETELRSPMRIACPRTLYVHIKREGSLWENRDPNKMIQAMQMVIIHMSDVMAGHSSAPVYLDWRHIYLPRLLKYWFRSIRRLPRIQRQRKLDEFLHVIVQLRKKRQFPIFGRKSFRFRINIAWRLLLSHIKPITSVFTNNTTYAIRRWQTRRLLQNIRRRSDRPVKVLFLITEISKWKTRSLLERMQESSRYEPIVGISLDNSEAKLTVAERNDLLEKRLAWFRERKIHAIPVYDAQKGKPKSLKSIKPDIVFYQQPWQIPDAHAPKLVSRFALTFYVPYFMIAFGNLDAECRLPFFKNIFGYFVQNRKWCRLFRSDAGNKGCRFIPGGHTIADMFINRMLTTSKKGLVIYAPHWTANSSTASYLYPLGTFEWNGKAILEYAQQHPDLKWVFKPHPLLRSALTKQGMMSQTEVDAYYSAWEKLGIACYDADYPDLFMRSRALITDCDSFLIEYAATKMPIIHLKNRRSQLIAMRPNRRLLDSYYQATDLKEMYRIFETVLEHGEDVQKEERLEAIRETGLFDLESAGRILRYLNRLLSCAVSTQK